MQSKTSLIEARLITGDEKLFEKISERCLSQMRGGHENEYIAARVAGSGGAAREIRQLACMQEPNIKNGCGGLRDYQNLLWMTFFKYRTRSLEEVAAEGNDQRRPSANNSKLLTIFCCACARKCIITPTAPRMCLRQSLQPAVAHNLGYTDRSPSKRLEKFMRDVYTHTRNIYLITRTLEQRMALVPQTGCIPSFVAICCRKPSGMQQPGRRWFQIHRWRNSCGVHHRFFAINRGV